MSNKKMINVHNEGDEASARIVVGFLQSNGIDARISEDDAGDQLPSLEAATGVQVVVPVEDAERARKLLDERETASDTD